jgi:hypothetical protein
VPTLYVKCTACQTDFPTPLGEIQSGEAGVIISSMRLRCPKCHREGEYSTKDFHGPQDSPGAEPAPVPDPGRDHEAHRTEQQQKLAGYGVVPPEDGTPHQS